MTLSKGLVLIALLMLNLNQTSTPHTCPKLAQFVETAKKGVKKRTKKDCGQVDWNPKVQVPRKKRIEFRPVRGSQTQTRLREEQEQEKTRQTGIPKELEGQEEVVRGNEQDVGQPRRTLERSMLNESEESAEDEEWEALAKQQPNNRPNGSSSSPPSYEAAADEGFAQYFAIGAIFCTHFFLDLRLDGFDSVMPECVVLEMAEMGLRREAASGQQSRHMQPLGNECFESTGHMDSVNVPRRRCHSRSGHSGMRSDLYGHINLVAQKPLEPYRGFRAVRKNGRQMAPNPIWKPYASYFGGGAIRMRTAKMP
ncbi:hypothetical protein DFH06DRAFT_1140983 [Mycena polygramma]|nr:hypothetical protein DFH06DRAFT_1140983 [Mycena polygramma]